MDRRRAILHVDMDAFFASVEVREDPDLRGKPVLVAGAGRRGVVCAASYEARVFGCHSAQPTAVALRRCPQAVVVPPRHSLYSEASSQVFEIFRRYSPLVEGLSIDEAFIDVTGTEKLFGPPRAVADSIRRDVFEQTHGLTCSVGIASVKFVAKIASAFDKPDGVTEVLPGHEVEFLGVLPIKKLWGVGPKMAEKLTRRGIKTVGDLARIDPKQLENEYGEHGAFLSRLSRGIDPRGVTPGRRAKSIGHEDTFHDDEVDLPGLHRRLLSQCQRVADRLVRAHLKGRRVTIKIRDTTFRTQTRQTTLEVPTYSAKVLYRTACELLSKLEIEGRRFRLTGVSVSGFEDRPEPDQLSLLADPSQPQHAQDDRLQEVLSAVRTKFGSEKLHSGDTKR